MTDLANLPTPYIVTDLPGPQAKAVIDQDLEFSSPSMPRVYPLVPHRASGCVLEDVDGNRFLDVNAGIAVNSTGHAHPEVLAAITDQASRILHYCSSDFYLPIYAELIEKLATSAPFAGAPARVFLANSGAEAVEGAIKLARYTTKRNNILAFIGSFHGRTLGALSLTASKAKYRAGFGPLLPGVYHAVYGEQSLLHLEQVIFKHLAAPEEFAAIVVEPIQGEGGYVVPPAGWLGALRELCDRHGILMICDEIQSGVGRTGKMWAIEHETMRDGSPVVPDIVLAGKGLASGLPLSAIIARAEHMTWPPGTHGSTFGGNPVACAAAVATLNLVERELMANASTTGDQMMALLRAAQPGTPQIQAVRGRGLMIGVDLPSHNFAHAVEQECFRRGLLVLTCGERTVRFAPPLVITPQQVTTAVSIFVDAIKAVAG